MKKRRNTSKNNDATNLTIDKPIIRKYVIIGSSDQNEYDLIVEESYDSKTIAIYANNNNVWTERTKGVMLMSMTDDGNNVEFNKLSNKMNYADMDMLKILTRFAEFDDKHNNEFDEKYKIVEQKILLEL